MIRPIVNFLTEKNQSVIPEVLNSADNFFSEFYKDRPFDEQFITEGNVRYFNYSGFVNSNQTTSILYVRGNTMLILLTLKIFIDTIIKFGSFAPQIFNLPPIKSFSYYRKLTSKDITNKFSNMLMFFLCSVT